MSTVAQDERRIQKRMGVRLPVALEWNGGDGMIRRTRGITRDISRNGMYCFVEEPIPDGQVVEFDLVFPVEYTATTPLAMHGQGTAVRTDATERRFGLAATIESRHATQLAQEGSEAERRIWTRVKPPVPMAVAYPGLHAEIRDLSTTGAFIADERPLPVGRTFDLRLQTGRNEPSIEVQAVVRRVEPQVGMAVEFTCLSEEAAARIRQMVQQGKVGNC